MKQSYTLPGFLALLLLTSGTVFGQMVGTDIFLRGHYVEVGISNLGFYGSDSAAPAGYHPYCMTPYCYPANGLGFVADPNMTGWSTSTASTTSHYMGDYFMPGSPFEGWELQVAGKRCQAFNFGGPDHFRYSGGMSACWGNNLMYSTSGPNKIGTWTGSVDSISVDQVTTLDTNDMFFTVKVTLTNYAVAPKNDIYYLRTLDPDNAALWPGGLHKTVNVIEHQMPGAYGGAVVSATDSVLTTAYLALGSTDTATRAVIYYAWPLDSAQDISAIYNGTYTGPTGMPAYYAEGIIHDQDLAMGIVKHIPHLATVDSAGDSVLRTTAGTLHPANSVSFTYFYSFSPAATDSAMTHSGGSTTRITEINNTLPIGVYPNPSKDVLNITNVNAGDTYALYDMMGRMATCANAPVQQRLNHISMMNLPAGAYILVVTDAWGSVRGRVPVRKI